MPTKSLESIKPKLGDAQLSRTQNHLELSSSQSEKVSVFKPEAEIYLNYFIRGLNIQEIIFQEIAARRRIDFVLLRETLSNIYWSHHLINEAEYKKSIESSEGLPAFDSLIVNPLIELSLNRYTNSTLFILPIILSIMILKLYFGNEVSSFFILFFPQVFLTAKGLASIVTSRFLFKNPEPMSLHFSLLGVYYKLSPGKRTAIEASQFLAHLIIMLGLTILSYIYFHRSKDPIFFHFGTLSIALMWIINISPLHNSDLSNFNFQIQNNIRRRLGIALSETTEEQRARFLNWIINILFNLTGLGFCVYCAFLSIQFLITKNYVFLIYTIIFDLAAIGVLVDLTDQFFVNRHWYQAKHLAARLKGSLTKHKDVQQMIRAIPIFEGLPEAALKQMVQSSKILQMNSGERICKHGDRTSDLYVVITGKVGIFRKETNGKTEKIIEINEGSIFGEGAFLLDRSRVGSAYCLKKTALLAIKRPKIVATSERLQEQNLSLFQKKIWGFQALAHSELFNEIPSEALMQLINNCEVKSVAEQSLVIRQGDFSDSLWIIVQGQCQVITDKGPIRDMHAKDIFGEIGLLWNSPRTSSVVTTAPCVLLKLSANHFWELMAQNLNLAIALQVLGESRLKLT